MTQHRQRVDAEPAFVLHSYPFRETSLIVEVFTRAHGRLALLARGARRPRSALRGLLLAFQPLEIGWAGRGEVPNLMKAEWVGGQPLLTGKALYCGYYLNELLLQLLPREDAHERLYAEYAQTLQQVASTVREADLRRFECALLQELGYGLTLTHTAQGLAVAPQQDYLYAIEHGPVPLAQAEASGSRVRGQTLLDMAQGSYESPRTLLEAKALMRTLIAHYLDGRRLETRRFFKGLNEP